MKQHFIDSVSLLFFSVYSFLHSPEILTHSLRLIEQIKQEIYEINLSLFAFFFVLLFLFGSNILNSVYVLIALTRKGTPNLIETSMRTVAVHSDSLESYVLMPSRTDQAILAYYVLSFHSFVRIARSLSHRSRILSHSFARY